MSDFTRWTAKEEDPKTPVTSYAEKFLKRICTAVGAMPTSATVNFPIPVPWSPSSLSTKSWFAKGQLATLFRSEDRSDDGPSNGSALAKSFQIQRYPWWTLMCLPPVGAFGTWAKVTPSFESCHGPS